MADYIDTLGTISSDWLDGSIVRQGTAQIDEFPVDTRRNDVATDLAVESVAHSSAWSQCPCLAIRGYRDLGTRNFSAHNKS
jgi:hypothetical protein